MKLLERFHIPTPVRKFLLGERGIFMGGLPVSPINGVSVQLKQRADEAISRITLNQAQPDDYSTVMTWQVVEGIATLNRTMEHITSGLPCTTKGCPVYGDTPSKKRSKARETIKIAIPWAAWSSVCGLIVYLVDKFAK